MKKKKSVTNGLALLAEYGFVLTIINKKITFKTNETKLESTSRSSFFIFQGVNVINRFVENARKEKAVDTAKLKKINSSH